MKLLSVLDEVVVQPLVLTEDGVKAILEQKYREGKFCHYLLDTQLPTSDGGWSYHAYAIFYQENPTPPHPHYFGLYWRPRASIHPDYAHTLMITDASRVEGVRIMAQRLPSGKVIFSRNRHDFFEQDGYFVDGGRDYMRCGGPDLSKLTSVTIRVKDGRLYSEEAGDAVSEETG